jgi:heterodisulfide reductase subunit D
MIELGIAPLAPHRELLNSIKNYDNPWLQPRTRRGDWAKGLEVKDFSKEPCEYLFFAGCTPAFDPRVQHEIVNVIKVLNKAGVDVGIFGDKEICCGSPAIRIGDRSTFFDLVKRQRELFTKSGVKKVITHCAGCHHVLKYDFPEVPGMPEMDFEVLHITEVLSRLVEEGRLQFTKEVPMSVTWHDPCHIGRHCGIYEEPRKILKAIPGLELIEMERIKDQAWCCGAGAGVRTAFPDLAFDISCERIEEAKQTGAEAIATCCPYCEQNLRDPIDRNKENLKMYDLMDLILMAM